MICFTRIIFVLLFVSWHFPPAPCLSSPSYAVSLFIQSLHIQILIWHFSPIYFHIFAQRICLPICFQLFALSEIPFCPIFILQGCPLEWNCFLLLIHLYVLEVSLGNICVGVHNKCRKITEKTSCHASKIFKMPKKILWAWQPQKHWKDTLLAISTGWTNQHSCVTTATTLYMSIEH